MVSAQPAPRARRPLLPPVVDVTVVLVAHDGALWLPRVLAALAAQTVRPAALVCVDTGSADGSAALLHEAAGEVLRLPATTGYPSAVRAGLAATPARRWVWLLHDDSAPEPGALEALLAQAAATPDAGLLGPKVRDWADPRVLVEVGLTVDALGTRETGLERGEHDQGQHDGVRDVLAVGTAGALVRRDVWDAVGGLDPALPLHGDDLDLGWAVHAAGHRVVVVPRAVVLHARATTTGARRPGAVAGRPRLLARRHAVLVVLARAAPLRLAWLLPLLLLDTGLRALLLLLLTRRPAEAVDEVRALAGLLASPRRMRAARVRRSARADVTHLLGHRRSRLRARVQALGDRLDGGSGGERGGLRRLLRRPGVQLVVALTAVALLAERALLPGGALGDGVLAGGRLLPAPEGAGALWRAYAEGWHAVGTGSGAPAPPLLVLLAAPATLLLGRVEPVLDVLLLLAVPVSGAVAYAVAGRLVRRPALRVWAAATWALLPVATGGVAAGRLDAVVGQLVLPPLALAGVRLLAADPRERGWRQPFAVGLGLAVVVAVAPVLELLAVALLVGAALLARLAATPDGRPRADRVLAAAVIACAVPLAVLFPWSLHVLRRPSSLLAGPGRVDPALSPPVEVLSLLLLSPGGPGTPAALLTAGLLVAALAGLLLGVRCRRATLGWAVALVGLAAAVLLRAAAPDGVPVWPGQALQVSALGLLAAALAAAGGLRRLRGAAFSWRQPAALGLALLAAVTPVLLGLGWLVRGADGPLARRAPVALPAYAAADLAAAPGRRALRLQVHPDGRLGWALETARGARLGDDAVPPADEQLDQLDGLVAGLVTPGSDAAAALATRSVGWVALGRQRADAVARALDSATGLVRRSGDEGLLLWQVADPAPRLQVLPPTVARPALAGAPAAGRELRRALPPRAVTDGQVPAGPGGRLLVLAEAADDGWRATLDGRELPRRTAWGWAQAFALPAEGGRIEVSRGGAGRAVALAVQALALLTCLALAAPPVARRDGFAP